MKKNILEQVLEFEERRHTYSKPEQERIKNMLLSDIDSNLNKAAKKFVASIQDINKL